MSIAEIKLKHDHVDPFVNQASAASECCIDASKKPKSHNKFSQARLLSAFLPLASEPPKKQKTFFLI